MRRPSRPEGLVSTARIQRGSVSGTSTIGRKNVSCATAGIVNGSERMTRSGGPSSASSRNRSPSGHSRGGGRSAGSPGGAPASTQRTMVSISASLSEASLRNCWMPTVLSRNHGGISRAATRARMARAQGRDSAYVSSDIGAMLPGRWHCWHLRWKMGATSFANVGRASPPAGWAAACGAPPAAPSASRLPASSCRRPARESNRAMSSPPQNPAGRTSTATYAFVQQQPSNPDPSDTSARSM